MRLDHAHQPRAQRRHADGDSDREPAARRDVPAQQVDHATFAIFRNEALCGGGEAEVERLADQQHPGPDIDVDAELEGAHPACEQHIGRIGQQRCGDADQEHGAGKPLHQQLVGVAETRLQTRPDADEWTGHPRCVFGAGQRQCCLREGGTRRPSKEPLIFGSGLPLIAAVVCPVVR